MQLVMLCSHHFIGFQVLYAQINLLLLLLLLLHETGLPFLPHSPPAKQVNTQMTAPSHTPLCSVQSNQAALSKTWSAFHLEETWGRGGGMLSRVQSSPSVSSCCLLASTLDASNPPYLQNSRHTNSTKILGTQLWLRCEEPASWAACHQTQDKAQQTQLIVSTASSLYTPQT